MQTIDNYLLAKIYGHLIIDLKSVKDRFYLNHLRTLNRQTRQLIPINFLRDEVNFTIMNEEIRSAVNKLLLQFPNRFTVNGNVFQTYIFVPMFPSGPRGPRGIQGEVGSIGTCHSCTQELNQKDTQNKLRKLTRLNERTQQQRLYQKRLMINNRK